MILDSFKLDGRAALVTGAARGIGHAIAVALAEAGADVAILDCMPLEDCMAAVQAAGRHAHGLHCDLGELAPAGAQSIVDECVERFGRLDILVNNAGIIRRAPALEMEPRDWEDVLAVDLTAAFNLSQAAARAFVAAGHGGKIVNIASMLSFQGGMHVASYAAAKSGLAGLTRALANEWAPLGTNVNAVAPGYVATEVTAALRGDVVRSREILERIPAGRWAEPADVAGAVVFLASDAAAYVHGAILPVDGGWLAR